MAGQVEPNLTTWPDDSTCYSIQQVYCTRSGNTATKEVLVELLSKKRPVKFDAGAMDEILNLKKKQQFRGLLTRVWLQHLFWPLKSSQRGGKDNEIPDESCLKVSVGNKVSSINILLYARVKICLVHIVATACRSISLAIGHRSLLKFYICDPNYGSMLCHYSIPTLC